MKKIFFSIILLVYPFLLFSQTNLAEENKRFELNVGIENQIPVNDFAVFYHYGLGISLTAEYKIIKNLSFTFDPAYVNYFYRIKSVDVTGSTPYIILPAGFKYYLPYKIFVEGQLGLAIKMLEGQKEDALAFSGGVGVYPGKKFNVEIKYAKIKAITTAPENICLRIGYSVFR